MEIRHQDIFPWNQLNIHILVVYSDAKLSIFGKKHSKVEESHQLNQIALHKVTNDSIRCKHSLLNRFHEGSYILAHLVCMKTCSMYSGWTLIHARQLMRALYCRIVWNAARKEKKMLANFGQFGQWYFLFCWATLVYGTTHKGQGSWIVWRSLSATFFRYFEHG